MGKYLQSLGLLGIISLPLQNQSQWRNYEFDDSPANKITYATDGVKIEVRKGVSPIFFVLKEPLQVKGFSLEATLSGLPQGKDTERNDYDDKVIRLGFVIPGGNQANFFERLFLPDWIIQISKESPTNGIEKILFYSVATPQTKGLNFGHSSRFVEEEIIKTISNDGPLLVEHQFKNSLQTMAVWFSADGDATQSDFDILIKELKLVVPD